MGAITPDDLRRLLDSDDPVAVIDVREPLDYTTGNVRESTLLPRRALEWRLPELLPRPDVPVVLVDGAGERAATDADWLRWLGLPNVRHLAGGVAAWRAAGYDVVEAEGDVLASAFNVPSKEFGEQVAVERDPERVEPERLAEWLAGDEDVVVADVRTPAEYREETLPGARNVEGVDLALYAEALREDPETKLVVHCAGRTRSLIGIATLGERDLDEVYGLENGTSGWQLAGFDLEEGAEPGDAPDLSPAERERAESFAEDLIADHAIARLSTDEVAAALGDDELAQVVDVRPREAFEAGHLPGAVGVPGGQAIQRADDYVAVPEATLVFYADGIVRPAVTAAWYARMGYENVAILDGGMDAWTEEGRPVETGSERTERLGLQRAVEQRHGCGEPLGRDRVADAAPTVAPADLDPDDATILYVGRSLDYPDGHLPGSRWVSRNDVGDLLDRERPENVVLTCADGEVSAYAAAALAHVGYDVRALGGGVAAWEAAGRPVETGEDGIGDRRDRVPTKAELGEDVMRGYLEWEEELGHEG
ncbi:MAG: rhodanese-like domain-containing protein [Haloferacaceae archaeon]